MSMRVAPIFRDHMVLQQGIPVPVWGWSQPGDKIIVSFGGKSKSAVANKAGEWSVKLAPLKASCESRPLTLRSACDQRTLTLDDVLVGEVWICSGQSNMEWPLASANHAAEEVAAADYPNMRLFTVPRKAELNPGLEIAGEWARCQPANAGGFSAVGYFFGREIHRKTGLPVGLINASWGGTIAEAWSSREALVADPLFRKVVKEYEHELSSPSPDAQGLGAKHREWAEKHDHQDTHNAGEAAGWQMAACPDAEWATMDLPRNWQSAGHDHSGIFWFRREIAIPAGWEGRDLTLSLGPTDKSDVTYFNGERVGSITMQDRPDAWCTSRTYTVPGRLVRAGRAVVAVRVFSNIFHGGFIGTPAQLSVVPVDDHDATPIALAGAWRYKIEANFGIVPPPPPPPRGAGNPNSPYMLYGNMIKPLVPYALRGAIWYQGESNASMAKQYRKLFPLMIRSWRDAWGQGGRKGSLERDFPFLFVQLANYQLPPSQPGENEWAELRDAQLNTLSLDNTGMAVAIDVGEANDIHPRDKQSVGYRLSLPALSRIYGFRNLVMSGPLCRAVKREKGRIRLEFDHAGAGLIARGGVLKGFAIAGADRKFVWANAVIAGADAVVVSSPAVPRPVAVRYGWDINPGCTLYNASDLPASPFKTDSWPGRAK